MRCALSVTTTPAARAKHEGPPGGPLVAPPGGVAFSTWSGPARSPRHGRFISDVGHADRGVHCKLKWDEEVRAGRRHTDLRAYSDGSLLSRMENPLEYKTREVPVKLENEEPFTRVMGTRGWAGDQFDRSCVCRAGCPTNNDPGGVWTGAPPFASAILSRGASRDAPDVPRARSRERARGSALAEARPRKRARGSAPPQPPRGLPRP